MFIQDYAITEICEVEMSLLLDSCHCLSRRFPGFERVELTFHPPTPRFRPILAILKFVITRNKETVPRVVVKGIRYMREHLCHIQEAAFITGLLPVFKVTNPFLRSPTWTMNSKSIWSWFNLRSCLLRQ